MSRTWEKIQSNDFSLIFEVERSKYFQLKFLRFSLSKFHFLFHKIYFQSYRNTHQLPKWGISPQHTYERNLDPLLQNFILIFPRILYHLWYDENQLNFTFPHTEPNSSTRHFVAFQSTAYSSRHCHNSTNPIPLWNIQREGKPPTTLQSRYRQQKRRECRTRNRANNRSAWTRIPR